MSYIKVRFADMEHAVSEYDPYKRDLTNVQGVLRGVISYRCMSGRYFSEIYHAIDREVEQLSGEKDSIDNLKNGLQDIIVQYKNCENDGEEGFLLPGISDALDILDKFGISGGLLAALGQLVIGDYSSRETTAEALLKALRELAYVGMASTAKGKVCPSWLPAPAGLKQEFAISMGFTNAIDGKSAGEAFINSLKDQFPGLSCADKTKIISTWGAYILTGLIQGVENIGEFCKDENGEYIPFDQVNWKRVLGETAVETATEIGMYVGISAGVTAVAAGLGIVAAPAVAVGAATVGIMWLANTAVKAATDGEKDVGEYVADAIFDSAAKVKEGCNALADKVGNAVRCCVNDGCGLSGDNPVGALAGGIVEAGVKGITNSLIIRWNPLSVFA